METKIHPRQKASLLSHWFFCWELSLFRKGFKIQLTEEDLYGPLKEHRSKKLGDKVEQAWEIQKSLNEKPSLWRVLIKVFGLQFFMYGLILIPLELVIKMSQPLLIGRLVIFFTPQQETVSKYEAYIYASLIILMSILNVVIGHSYYLGLQHLGMKIRVACSSLIYRKLLKLNQNRPEESSVGQMVNLLANDVNRFDYAILQFHFLWMAPLETIIILVLLYMWLGATAVVGTIFFLGFIPLQMYLSKKISVYRMQTALKTDGRVQLMNEIIGGIQVIKMYTWEKPFAKLVEKSRRMEILKIKSSSYLRAINMSSQIFLSRMAVFCCILFYIMTGNSLRPDYVYVLTAFYDIIRLGSVIFFPLAMTFFGETVTSVKRIENFLTSNEISQKDNNSSNVFNGIKMDNITVKWDDSNANILTDITLKVEPGQLVGIVGPVGSGKTTLLQVITKEIGLKMGTIDVSGKLSYTSQQPWLFSGSIKQNILFGLKLDRHKYKEVIKVCALEQDFSVLPFGDETLVGDKGVMLSGGQKSRINLARAVYKEADFYLLDDPLSAVDAHVGKALFENCIKSYLKDKTRILVTHQLQYLQNVDFIYVIENGRVTTCGTYDDLKNSNNEFIKLLGSDENKEKDNETSQTFIYSENYDIPTEIKENRTDGVVSNKIYLSYLKAGGTLITIIFAIALHVLVQVTGNGSDYFLAFWINLEQEEIKNTTLTSDYCLYIYTGLIIILVAITLICYFYFFIFCMKASSNLHRNMFYKIVYSPMQFFHANPSGRILNRFSKDIGLIDESLPLSMTDTISIILNALGITIIISMINPWITIPTVIMFIMFYYYRIVFLATSRNLKRIEGRTRSPIFSLIASSLEGLGTIRAFNAQDNLRNNFDNFQDVHSSSYYLFLACDSAYGFWLDFTCVIYLALVTLSFLFIGTEMYGGNVGLTITQSIMMTGMLQWGMKQWSQLENQMISVERVVEYTKLVSEESIENKTLTSWPSDGKIEFKTVSLRYAPEEPLVLKQLTFTIQPKEKIGIVGRTGAGKSSLVSIFFRLAQIEGDVIIDGININNISLKNLRSKISIIPQEPVIFSGTIRYNLDPFSEFQDDQLWNSLEEVELKSFVSDLPSGLSHKISEGGINFSVGQRQLLCLARALVRMNKILILDEATANVDLQTDELIQNTIRRKFKNCTVLTIAHRLCSIMDSDKILVMDGGYVKEFDHPYPLLQNSNGLFYKLVQQNGKEVAANLMKQAKIHYTSQKIYK